MLTVLVTNIKGGCGKTTIATNLAGAFANTGLVTALADCDRQKSSLAWTRARPRDRAPVAGLNWGKEPGKPPKGTDRLVIDAPAGLRRHQTEILIRMADIVVLPVLPSVFDENATRKLLGHLDRMKPVRKGRRAVAVIGNRVKPRTRAAEHLDRFLTEAGHPVVTRLRDSQLYWSAAIDGLSLFDMPAGKSRGHVEDWRPLLSFLDENTARLGV